MKKHEELAESIESSIKKCCEGKRVGVSFSGGLDSGLVSAIASKYAKSVTLYTCAVDNSFDVNAGKELAEKLDLPWVQCRISEENIESTIKEMILATKVSDPFTISYDLQLFCVCREATERVILTGQGCDEYFAGCANSVNENDEAYRAVMQWGVDRLMKVSVPCEMAIAKHFKKKLFYPYLDEKVISNILKLEENEIRPRSLEERKMVLREIASDLGFPVLKNRTKKASQYGSGTTDLIRSQAKKNKLRYNGYIAGIYESMGLRTANLLRDSALDVRIDPIIQYDAEKILEELEMTHSEVVAAFYKKMIKEGNIDFLEK